MDSMPVELKPPLSPGLPAQWPRRQVHFHVQNLGAQALRPDAPDILLRIGSCPAIPNQT